MPFHELQPTNLPLLLLAFALPNPESRIPNPPTNATLRVALVAGEASGDGLGAGLIAALRARFPNAEFAGIGGDAMRAAGCDTWFDANELAVMGLAEVLRHLPRLLRLRKAFRQRVLDWKPDVYIGIDAPDFNLGVERWLKERGVRTVHYVSPSVWAWRQKRVLKIREGCDLMLKQQALGIGHGSERFIPIIQTDQLQRTASNTTLLVDSVKHQLGTSLVEAGLLLAERERALRDNEERLRLIIDGVKDYGIFALDTAGHVTSWNNGAERIKGYTEQEILGQHFSAIAAAACTVRGSPG